MIETSVQPDATTICRAWGHLNWNISMALRHAVHDALLPGGVVVVDLSQVSAIDAVGLSVLLGCLRRARAMGANILIRNTRPQVRARLDLVMDSKPASLVEAIDGNEVA